MQLVPPVKAAHFYLSPATRPKTQLALLFLLLVTLDSINQSVQHRHLIEFVLVVCRLAQLVNNLLVFVLDQVTSHVRVVLPIPLTLKAEIPHVSHARLLVLQDSILLDRAHQQLRQFVLHAPALVLLSFFSQALAPKPRPRRALPAQLASQTNTRRLHVPLDPIVFAQTVRQHVLLDHIYPEAVLHLRLPFAMLARQLNLVHRISICKGFVQDATTPHVFPVPSVLPTNFKLAHVLQFPTEFAKTAPLLHLVLVAHFWQDPVQAVFLQPLHRLLLSMGNHLRRLTLHPRHHSQLVVRPD